MFSLNIMLFIAGGAVAVTFLLWSVTARRQLDALPLGGLPRAIGWMMAWESASALVYAVARYGRGTGQFDMWDLLPILIACRLGLLASTILHMPPYWLAAGAPMATVRRRKMLTIVLMAAMIPAMTLWFW